MLYFIAIKGFRVKVNCFQYLYKVPTLDNLNGADASRFT